MSVEFTESTESPQRPDPRPTRNSAFFWEAAERGVLMAQRCGECKRFRHPPRPMCPHCHSLEREEVECSGHGKLHSWAKPVHPPLPMFEPGYLVALIELDEGIRLLSNLCDIAPEDIENDMAVEVFFAPTAGGKAVPQFSGLPLAGVEEGAVADHSGAVIAGIGQTEFSKNSGRSELQLACECIKSALDDAGLTPADVDGMTTFTVDNNEDVDLVRSLGVKNLRFSSRVGHGGGGSVGTLAHAMAAVDGGLADVVVGWRAMNERSEFRFGISQMDNVGGNPGAGTGFIEWSLPFGSATPAAWTAVQAQRYMHRYGVTNEDFGHVSVQLRKYAATNPNAFFYERPITLADHQASRWIVEPIFRLLDCTQESDGGVAWVVTSEERARDARQPGVRICHATQAVPFEYETVTNYYRDDLTRFESGVKCAEELYRRTGLGPRDFQVAMLYDHFTIAIYWHLEANGFCKQGEAAEFVKDGQIDIDGSIPVSPNGGHIGEAYIHGMNNIAEAVRQIRGTAANQVHNVEHVLVSAGMSGAILGKL